MRNVLKVISVVATFALAGCVYPGYSYVRDSYGAGYYTGEGYGGGYGYAPAYPGYYYGCCDYGPSVNIGIGYYDHYYGRGYRGYRGPDGYSWRGNRSRGSWHGSSSHHRRHSHQDGTPHDH